MTGRFGMDLLVAWRFIDVGGGFTKTIASDRLTIKV